MVRSSANDEGTATCDAGAQNVAATSTVFGVGVIAAEFTWQLKSVAVAVGPNLTVALSMVITDRGTVAPFSRWRRRARRARCRRARVDHSGRRGRRGTRRSDGPV